LTARELLAACPGLSWPDLQSHLIELVRVGALFPDAMVSDVLEGGGSDHLALSPDDAVGSERE
jgi:hypothetical protein